MDMLGWNYDLTTIVKLKTYGYVRYKLASFYCCEICIMIPDKTIN